MTAREDQAQAIVVHYILLGVAARNSAAWACRSSRDASRRRRSIARLRAVVMIHPTGLAEPARGPPLHRCRKRVLHRLLDEGNVTEDTDQHGHRAMY
jgi:hypothetical protein